MCQCLLTLRAARASFHMWIDPTTTCNIRGCESPQLGAIGLMLVTISSSNSNIYACCWTELSYVPFNKAEAYLLPTSLLAIERYPKDCHPYLSGLYSRHPPPFHSPILGLGWFSRVEHCRHFLCSKL